MLEHDEDRSPDYCPECGVGRVSNGSKPYLKLYRGKLFTMPDALVWQCDVCEYCEFDDSVYDIISGMIGLSDNQSGHYGMTRHFSANTDDDLSHKPDSSGH